MELFCTSGVLKLCRNITVSSGSILISNNVHENKYIYIYIYIHMYIEHNCIDDNRNVHMYCVSGYQKKPRLIELAVLSPVDTIFLHQ